MNSDSVRGASDVASDSMIRAVAAQERSGDTHRVLDLHAVMKSQPSASLEPFAARSGGVQSGFDLPKLYGAFSDGLSNGFITPDLGRLVAKMDQVGQPGGLTVGQMTAELMNVQLKTSMAEACSKIGTKLVEGLQTLVVRQG
jgi:hypothetical protein